MEQAPYFADIARNDTGAAHWLRPVDGVRIRVGHWPLEAARGTVILFPGRTEYVEKYGVVATALAARGFASLAIDWRGQGLADRLHDNRALGHVGRFEDYQLDAQAAMAHARSLGLPEPFHLMTHSMGGAIGLRALFEGYPVETAVFSAPMWGIRMAPPLRPVAWGLSTLSRPLGFSHLLAPGQSEETYVLRATAEDNTLTSDPEMFAMMQGQLRAHPELSLGGPSLHWLNEALREVRDLSRRPAPTTPCLTFLGGDEDIVDSGRIMARMSAWHTGRLVVLPGARHEVLLETPEIRTEIHDQSARLFDTRQAKAA